ncbi:cytochrome P450 [Glycomyces sp. L485]|uniref:cytochrome P450 n=1 Tax=Glycomyces sp. L485 TaxID=2909235 RepID=UPI001F4B3EDC|nr:cytochrome P450 [Glycomyces sp. L485]MCH7229802.1 cytochrome P450 [Glycomyces sp. L485]
MNTSTSIPILSGARPLVGHAVELTRDPLGLFRRGHREHGSMFRLRLPMKDTVVLLGSEHNDLTFAETDRKLSIRTAYPFFLRMFSPDFYFFAPYDEYKRQRQVVLPRFQGRQLDTYVEVMENEAKSFKDGLGDSGVFTIPDDFGPLIMRVAAHAFLGERFAHTTTDWFAEFRRFSEGADFVTPGWLPAPHLLRSRAAGRRIRERLQDIVDRRREEPGDGEDFLDSFVKAEYDDGSPVPDDILIHLIIMLVWAGHETTTGQIAWGLIDLLRHPAELERVRAELSHLPEVMNAKDVRRLAHLDRCLHESERLHPVAPMTVRSAVEPMEVDGHEIPAGSMVMLSPAMTHRLPEEFPEPDAYRPDRYVDEPDQLRRLIGFGGGLHRCLGMRFAYLEMTVVLARLLQDYDFELLAPDPQPVTGQGAKWPEPTKVAYLRR